MHLSTHLDQRIISHINYSAKVHAFLHAKEWGHAWEDLTSGVLSVTLSFPSMKHRDVPKSTRFGKKPRNRQRNITTRMTKKQHYNSKSVLRGPATNWGHSFPSDIKGKHICHDCRKWGKVPVRLGSVESADRRNRKGSDGTVTHRYLHEVVFKHPATFDLLLLQRCRS